MNDKKVIALGMFDGVHIGHRALIRKAKEMAEAENAFCLVYSFSNHPNQLLGKPYSLLTTNKEKDKLLKEAGADEIVLDLFTEELMHIQPRKFLDTLCERWDVCGMVAGYNYTFGEKGSGNPQMMEEFCKDNRIQYATLPSVEKTGFPVSSTRIRNLLNEGKILSAAGCLGYPYLLNCSASISEMGTEYIVDKEKALPKSGKYALKITTNKRIVFGYYKFNDGSELNGIIQIDSFVPEEDENDISISFVSEL